MKRADVLIELNNAHLEQGIRLMEVLDQDAFTQSDPPVYASGIGEHMRHILEHYQTFLAGIGEGVVDYDARQRNLRISTERSFAMKTARDIIAQLSAVDPVDRPVRVKMAVSDDLARDTPWSDSTLRRELQYLQAHTIHHYALIALIVRIQGRELPDDFGVAPSTLQHRLEHQNA